MNAPIEPIVEPFVLSQTSGQVARLTLNRGERYNPLSLEMIDALRTELDHIAENSAVRVVVIAGAGKGFSAGHDLSASLAREAEYMALTGASEDHHAAVAAFLAKERPEFSGR